MVAAVDGEDADDEDDVSKPGLAPSDKRVKSQGQEAHEDVEVEEEEEEEAEGADAAPAGPCSCSSSSGCTHSSSSSSSTTTRGAVRSFLLPSTAASKKGKKAAKSAAFPLVHEKLKPFKCKECTAAYTSGSMLRDHVNAVHRGIKLKCPQCPAEFASSSNLGKHLRFQHKS